MADGQIAMTPELKKAFEDYQRAVEGSVDGFKAKNDERLAGIEKKFDDVVAKEQVDRINAALDELKDNVNKEIAEIKRAGKGGGDREEKQEKKQALLDLELDALDVFVREGKEAGHRAIHALGEKVKELGFERKDLSTVVLGDGGVAVRPEWEAEMIEVVEEESDVRQIARVMESGSQTKKVLVDKGGAAAAWADELDERTRTAHAQLAERDFVADELYALNWITETMKEDAVFDIMDWLMENATDAMARAEGAAFINGNGVKKPKGILAQSIVANSSWSWGSLGYIATGQSAGFAPAVPGDQLGPTASTNGADALLDLIYAVKKPFRKNCNFLMNRLTMAEVRKLKDAQGNYLFKDDLRGAAFLSTLLGYPVQEFEDMPDIAADSYSIAFGDFYKGYWIIDRAGISVKRDDITSPQYDKVYVRRRVGGDVANYEAIKLLKFSAS